MKDSDASENNLEAEPETYKENISNSVCCQSNNEVSTEEAGCETTTTATPQVQENPTPESGITEVRRSEFEQNTSNANASTSESVIDGVPVSDSKRKFRVLGLNFPGKWMENEMFLDILHKSETFHLWFEKASEGKVKPGGASILFESVAEAKNAFAEVQKMKIDGCLLKLQASKLFYEDSLNADDVQTPEKVMIPFDVEAAQNDAMYRLYAIHLHSSTKQDLLTSIFDPEYVKGIKLANDPYAPSEMQAEIIFSSKQEADTAQAELDELEIEEFDRMVLLSTNEYVAYMKKAALESISAQPRVAATTSISNPPDSGSITQLNVPHVAAPELSVDDVAGLLQKHVEETRTNWAELNEVAELWKLCDVVSKEHNGIPDSLLKYALLSVLEEHRNALQEHWLRNHLEELIKLWKKEVQSAKSAPREGAVAMSAPTYSPPEVARRRNRQNKKMLSTLMGVGALLNTARTVLAVEEGEVEVDEDEHGIFSINGQELTFETWGNLSKPSSAKEVQQQAQIKPEHRKLWYQYKKEMREKKMEDEKIKLMQESMKPLEQELEQEKTSLEDNVKESAARPSVFEPNENVKKRELEEGEMSSETSSSSSSPSSSSEESMSSARNRRRKRRRHKKHNSGLQIPGAAANPQFTQLLIRLYEQRHRLIRSLQPSQKSTFAAVLNQIASSPQGMTSAQRNEMNAFMSNYATNTFPSK